MARGPTGDLRPEDIPDDADDSDGLNDPAPEPETIQSSQEPAMAQLDRLPSWESLWSDAEADSPKPAQA